MQRRWEEFDDYKLTWEEVEGVIQDVLNESVSNTIEDLMDKGALNMSINKDGEILYKANKDFNFDEL